MASRGPRPPRALPKLEPVGGPGPSPSSGAAGPRGDHGVKDRCGDNRTMVATSVLIMLNSSDSRTGIQTGKGDTIIDIAFVRGVFRLLT